MSDEQIHFVTGKLAEPSLRGVLERLAPSIGFRYTVEVLNISVAALMTTDWIAGRLRLPDSASRVILPGYCRGDIAQTESTLGVPVVLGPKDLQELPDFFGQAHSDETNYGEYDIEILAEINHVAELAPDMVVSEAQRLSRDGADVIDLGCDPGQTFAGAGDLVRAVRDLGIRVSIDSMNPSEIEAAARAGAELVLSVNSSNVERAADWGCEVVAIPDDPGNLEGLDSTIDRLSAAKVKFRVDPVLEPIGFGFAQSLGRYLEARRRWPEVEMMMGIGNLTELTDADTGPINVLLLGFCQELGIRSILTTEVIHWAQSSVRECDLARRLVYHAIHNRTLPKHREAGLHMLRDASHFEHGAESLAALAARITDPNFRLFADGGLLHVMSRDLYLTGDDPFELFERLLAARDDPPDASHAFYLGYEMAKAVTALTLGKQYRQDQALQWGLLTREEPSHYGRKPTTKRHRRSDTK